MLHASPFQPLKIPEGSYLMVCLAATWLCPTDRDAFWLQVRNELAAQPELGEGVIARAIASAFQVFYRPIEVPDEPNLLGKITRGSNRYAAKLDAIEARRTRRERSDARLPRRTGRAL
jgi:hypothetical protein